MIKKICALILCIVCLCSCGAEKTEYTAEKNLPSVTHETEKPAVVQKKEEKEIKIEKTPEEIPIQETEEIIKEEPVAEITEDSVITETEIIEEPIPLPVTEQEEVIPQENPVVTEVIQNTPEEEIQNIENECFLSVRCDTILNNLSKLNPEKAEIVPKNGIIFPETKVEFYDEETAFNILTRELKKNKIHFDFEISPVYNTAYIKGISNLYEFDCGELSGWIFKVNGEVPGYGCSQQTLKPGDKIEFVYTCDMGKDIF